MEKTQRISLYEESPFRASNNQEGKATLYFITKKSTRVSERMNKHVSDYLWDKRINRDIPTEEKDFERSKLELKFKPNIDKSKRTFERYIKPIREQRPKQDILQKQPPITKSKII